VNVGEIECEGKREMEERETSRYSNSELWALTLVLSVSVIPMKTDLRTDLKTDLRTTK
jgi:hypothetical protein